MSNAHLYAPSRNPIWLGLIVQLLNYNSSIRVRLKSVQVEEKCISLCGRSLWGSAVLAAAAVQPAIWYWVAKRAWQPEGNQLRGSNHITDRLFISNHFHDKQPRRELWNWSKGLCNSMFRSYMKDGSEPSALFCICCIWGVCETGLWLQCCCVKPCWQSLWAEENREAVWWSWIMLFTRELLYNFSTFSDLLSKTHNENFSLLHWSQCSAYSVVPCG